MATLANLDVNLFARTKRFDAPIRKSESVFGGFARRVGSFSGAKMAAGIGAIAAAGAGLVGAHAVISKTIDQFGRIDELAKFSDAVGGNITDLKALQLQAELTGAGSEALKKGVERFNRILGDARAGDTTALDGFDQLQLKVDQFDGLNLTDQIKLVTAAINKGETAADRASNAYAIFGRQSADLQNFFAGGEVGIDAAVQDIENFNAGLSRVDAAQVEMANDAFTRLGTLTDAIFQKLAIEAAPIVTALVEMFIDGATEAGGFADAIETGFSFLIEGIAFGVNAWNAWIGTVNLARGGLIEMFSIAVRGLEAIQEGINYLTGADLDFGIRGLADELQKEAREFQLKGGIQVHKGITGAAGDEFKQRIEDIKKRAGEIAKAAEQVKPPEPTPDLALAYGRFGETFLSGFQTQLSNFDPVLDGWKLGKPDGPVEIEAQRPSVAAVTRGSSAAQDAINKARGANRGIEEILKENHEEGSALMTEQRDALVGIHDKIKKPSGRVVRI